MIFCCYSLVARFMWNLLNKFLWYFIISHMYELTSSDRVWTATARTVVQSVDRVITVVQDPDPENEKIILKVNSLLKIGRDRKVKIKVPELSSNLYSFKQFSILQVKHKAFRLKRWIQKQFKKDMRDTKETGNISKTRNLLMNMRYSYFKQRMTPGLIRNTILKFLIFKRDREDNT